MIGCYQRRDVALAQRHNQNTPCSGPAEFADWHNLPGISAVD